jgi:hypothetical protein
VAFWIPPLRQTAQLNVLFGNHIEDDYRVLASLALVNKQVH